jgi:hypothetical protein
MVGHARDAPDVVAATERRSGTQLGGCGSATAVRGLAISFTRAMATAYSTSPTTKPTRFLEGS